MPNTLREKIIEILDKKLFSGFQREHKIEELADQILSLIIEDLPEKNSYTPRLCQNRNFLDYCCTCEQSWENCSCLARNTGYNAYRQKLIKMLKGV